MDGDGELPRPQPYTTSYRQLRNGESGSSLPHGRVHWPIIQYQEVNSENIHAINIIQTKHVVFTYLRIYVFQGIKVMESSWSMAQRKARLRYRWRGSLNDSKAPGPKASWRKDGVWDNAAGSEFPKKTRRGYWWKCTPVSVEILVYWKCQYHWIATEDSSRCGLEASWASETSCMC